ncbi:MAG: transcription antiterminator [Tissierellia bacterium]|nr:transcription antiterminator [Tissierellia bacterium]
MKTNALSQRQKNIIYILAQADGEYTTIKSIADKLSLSTRTVQRDLADIEFFLEDNDFHLVKKPGQGLILDESEESIDFLYELMDMVDSSKQYEKAERINFILSRLLISKHPIKSYTFSVYLNISEKTLNEDLNLIDKRLSKYDIKLIKKRGEGISLEASERSIRKAQSSLINDVLNEEKKMEILRNINDKTKIDLIKENDVLSMVDRTIINKAKKALNKAFLDLNIKISDDSYIGLLVHISLAVERLKNNNILSYNDELKQSLGNTREYRISQKIIDELENEFHIIIPDEEIFFIAMHIKSTKIINRDQELPDQSDLEEALNVANYIIYRMDLIYKLDLEDDQKLKEDLRAHLVPALSRLKFDLSINNPILEDIKSKYSQIYLSLKDIVPEAIEKYAEIGSKRSIPDDEIAYIAIHFITSIEGKIITNVKVNVLTVCPTGYGTSRLLATNLTNQFSNINIVGNASVMKIDQEFLKKKKVDLIISTVDIDEILANNKIDPIKYIRMSALPSQTDLLDLNPVLRNISRNKFYSGYWYNIDGEIKSNNTNIIERNSLGREIFEITRALDKVYQSIKYFSLDGLKEIDDITEASSKALANNEKEYEIIKKSIEERNKLGSTYFAEYKLHLLHGKSHLDHAILGFGLDSENNERVIAMITPITSKKEVKNLFSKISQLVIEDKSFILSISNKDSDSINKYILNEIYKIIEEKLN